MATIKTIAIVGAAGKMGSAVAQNLQGKYRLLLISRDETKTAELRSKIGKSNPNAEVYAVSCAREAAWEADIIIIATPYGAERRVAEKIREVAVGKIVISVSNPLDTSYTGLIAPGDISAAEELQRLLPYSKVVKTFNTTFDEEFATLTKGNQMADVFIAGNSREAVETVGEVISAAGFNPVYVGDLTMSRALERMRLWLLRQHAQRMAS